MNTFHKTSLLHNTLIAAVLLALFIPQLAFAQSFVHDILWRLVNAVFGYAAAIGGMTLDYAVTHYVIGFGENFRTSGTGNSVNILWALVRDIFNLTFIFGLVYIGLKLILKSGDSQARGMLISLILAALLVNFSLFITKFVVDFSNIAAAQIANAFLREGSYQISAAFMNIMGHTDLFNARGSLQTVAGTSAGFTFIFSTMFIYIILAFVFLAGGIMLIIRYVVLIIYMILSPVMFLGWVFPGFAGASQDFWKKFLSRAFFAPAYLLMLYFSNQILVNMRGANSLSTGDMVAATAGQTGPTASSFGAVFPFFFMAAGFLIASLVVAQKMGTVGASTAISAGHKLRGYTQRAVGAGTAGAAAIALQRSVGYGAQKYANSDTAKQKASTSRFHAGVLKASRAVGNTSFDARQIGDVGKNLGIGTGTKGGYQSRVDAKVKADSDFAKSLGETKIEKDERGRYTDTKIAERVEGRIKEMQSDQTSKLYKQTNQLQASNIAKQNAQAALAAVDMTSVTKEEMTRLKANLQAAERDVEKNSNKMKEVQAQARTSAEASVTYEKQLAFIKRRESEANFMTSRKPNLGSAAAGATGGGVVATAVGAGALATGAGVVGAGIIAAPIAHSFGSQTKESVGNLRKMYGTDGSAAVTAKQKKEQFSLLEELRKENVEPESKKEDA
jgi:hypothetical protein